MAASLLSRVDDWAAFPREPVSNRDTELLRTNARTGKPLGSDSFIDALERVTERRLRPGKPGPKSAPASTPD